MDNIIPLIWQSFHRSYIRISEFQGQKIHSNILNLFNIFSKNVTMICKYDNWKKARRIRRQNFHINAVILFWKLRPTWELVLSYKSNTPLRGNNNGWSIWKFLLNANNWWQHFSALCCLYVVSHFLIDNGLHMLQNIK